MIRQLTPDDLCDFTSVWGDGLKRFPEAFLLTVDEMQAIPEQTLIEGLEAGVHWGAFEDAQLIGFASMRRGGPLRLRHTADIGPFYIMQNAQRRGHAKRLLLALLEHATSIGLSQVELCVDAQNAAAIALYQSVGFEIFGTRPRSVMLDGVPRDDHLMMKLLDSS